MRTESGWVALRKRANRFSQILVKDLQDSAVKPGSDPAEHYRLGRDAFECIAFRRSLLERRRGPKWSETEQLHIMEQQVDSVMSGLDRTGVKSSQSELSSVSKEVKEFWRLRKNLRKQ